MSNRRIKLQLWLIYGIIIAAFLGSALLFSYLNTSAMMSAVEKETDLAASILTADMYAEGAAAEGPADAVSADLARELDERLSRALDDAGVEIDVWVVDDAGAVRYDRGGVFPTEAWAAMERAATDAYASAMRWIGEKNPFWPQPMTSSAFGRFMPMEVPDAICHAMAPDVKQALDSVP